MSSDAYLLAGQAPEVERLRLQALFWEPASRAMFDAIPVQRGWTCADVGCGAVGVLRPLAEAVGPEGRVVGFDADERLLDEARQFIGEAGLSNVSVQKVDLFGDALPADAFDLVHLRFMFAPIGREQEILGAAIRLCRSGGVVAVQEPDAGCWSLVPPRPAFDRLKDILFAAFRKAGGDFNAGRRTFALLRDAGLQNVRIRAAAEALPPRHRYLRVILQLAASLRERIVGTGIASADELDRLMAEVEALVSGDDTAGTTFLVTQVWGTKV